MRKSYPSDVSRKQFEKIRPILESSRKKTRPRKFDLYEVFCGILYVLKSACQWRMLTKDFPRWKNVYYYFQIWNKKNGEEPSLLELVLKKLVGEVRINNARKEKTSFCIIDSQNANYGLERE